VALNSINRWMPLGGVLLASIAAYAQELTPSTTEQIVREIRDALAAGDAQRLSDLVVFPERNDDKRSNLERAKELVEGDQSRACRMMIPFLEGLALRTIDREPRWPGVGHWEGPADARRVIFEQAVPVEITARYGPRVALRAFMFVKEGDRWKWRMPSAMVPLSWEYSCESAENSYHALVMALDAREYRTIYDLIDPELLPSGPDRDAWLSVVRERTATVDQGAARSEAARNAAKAEGRPIPKDIPPPFVAKSLCGLGKGEAHYANEEKTVANVSDRWNFAAKHPGPVPYETFVKRGDRWYWQPKPEYTLWPLVTNTPPATQPTPPLASPRSQ
jgi:hypothetical protein